MTTPDTPAPEMEAEFLRLVEELWHCSYIGSSRWRGCLDALHRWHREQVELAVAERDAAWRAHPVADLVFGSWEPGAPEPKGFRHA